MRRPLCFIATETTSLRDDREVWEAALIRRDIDGQRYQISIMMPVTLAQADPTALTIGRFYERHPVGRCHANGGSVEPGELWTRPEAARAISRATLGATIVGAQPEFDLHGLRRILADAGHLPAWHHRTVDVESLVAGSFARLVGGLADPPGWTPSQSPAPAPAEGAVA